MKSCRSLKPIHSGSEMLFWTFSDPHMSVQLGFIDVYADLLSTIWVGMHVLLECMLLLLLLLLLPSTYEGVACTHTISSECSSEDVKNV